MLFRGLFVQVFFDLYLTNCFQKQLKEAEFGNDVQSVKAEYERHQKEHKIIDQVLYYRLFNYLNSLTFINREVDNYSFKAMLKNVVKQRFDFMEKS